MWRRASSNASASWKAISRNFVARTRPVIKAEEPTKAPDKPVAEAPASRSEFVTGLVWFVIGIIVGLGILAAAFWHNMILPR